MLKYRQNDILKIVTEALGCLTDYGSSSRRSARDILNI